jgi:hypothetical protein
MPVIVASGMTPRIVVVNNTTSVGSVTARSSSVRIPDQGVSLGAVTERTTVVQVASTGVQGAAGAPGGTSEPRIASEALGGHRVVRSTGADTVGYASSDNPLHGDDTQGMTLGAASSGATVTVQRTGSVTFNGWAWTQGEPVFLGTGGLPTQNVPTAGFVQVIGHAESADTLFLQIEPPIYFED